MLEDGVVLEMMDAETLGRVDCEVSGIHGDDIQKTRLYALD